MCWCPLRQYRFLCSCPLRQYRFPFLPSLLTSSVLQYPSFLYASLSFLSFSTVILLSSVFLYLPFYRFLSHIWCSSKCLFRFSFVSLLFSLSPKCIILCSVDLTAGQLVSPPLHSFLCMCWLFYPLDFSSRFLFSSFTFFLLPCGIFFSCILFLTFSFFHSFPFLVWFLPYLFFFAYMSVVYVSRACLVTCLSFCLTACIPACLFFCMLVLSV